MIIDFRVRPPLPSFKDHFIYASHFAPRPPDRSMPLHWDRQESRSAREYSLSLFFEELDAAGITHGVVMGRISPSQYGTSSNDEIAGFCDQYQDRFCGFAGIDGSDDSASQTVRWAKTAGFKGIALDNGWVGLHQDADKLMPIYEAAAEEELVVALTASQLMGDDLSYSHPDRIRTVAKRFPELPLVVTHGAWPWTTLASALSFECRNVYLLPDCYLNVRAPGWRSYVDAANGFMSDRLLYGSAYPVRPLKSSIDAFRQLGLDHLAQQRALVDNARNLLSWP